jgi:hypothetical protein
MAKKKQLPVVLYHGTLRENVPGILTEGLHTSEGMGWEGNVGVYLAGSIDSAMYWAKFAFQLMHDEDDLRISDAEDFDLVYGKRQEEFLAIVEVTIPYSYTKDLRADMEQAEDVDFEGDETDWKLSLKEIGDVMFVRDIPPEWIKLVY